MKNMYTWSTLSHARPCDDDNDHKESNRLWLSIAILLSEYFEDFPNSLDDEVLILFQGL